MEMATEECAGCSPASDAACRYSIRLDAASSRLRRCYVTAPGRAQPSPFDTCRQTATDAVQQAPVVAQSAAGGMRVMVRQIRGVLRQALVSCRKDYLYASQFRVLRRIGL